MAVANMIVSKEGLLFVLLLLVLLGLVQLRHHGDENLLRLAGKPRVLAKGAREDGGPGEKRYLKVSTIDKLRNHKIFDLGLVKIR